MQPAAPEVSAAPAFRQQMSLPVAPAPLRAVEPSPKPAVRAEAPAPVQVTPPMIARRVPPVFPENVRRMFIGERRVAMTVTVDKSGAVTGSSCVACADRTDAVLAALASAALKNWKFQPALLGKQPTAGSTTVEFRFSSTRR